MEKKYQKEIESLFKAKGLPVLPALTFSDVTIQSQWSDIVHRSDINNLKARLGRNFFLNIPIISANMSDVTGVNMAISLAKLGGLSFIPQFTSLEDRLQQIKEIKSVKIDDKDEQIDKDKESYFPHALKDKEGRLCIGATLRLSANYLEEAKAFIEAGADVLLLDTARAGSNVTYNATKEIKNLFPDCVLIVGNIDNPQHVAKLAEAGADGLKIGIGPGSRCKTRMVTGVGVPQIHAVLGCYAVAKELGVTVISDGGIRNSSDFAKSLGAGADCVMLGSLLAGTEESPSLIVKKIIDGREQLFKKYRGSASLEHQLERIKNGNLDLAREPEGESIEVPYAGTLSSVVSRMINGLRSSMSYVGAHNLEEFKNNVEFIWVSHSGFDEGKPRG